MINSRFGRLVIIDDLRYKFFKTKKGISSKKVHRVIAKCDCGKIKEVSLTQLKNGQTTSCGCYANERTSKRFKKHGLRFHPLYAVFDGMKKRCYNKKDKSFTNYGRRGISICNEWINNFISFYNWSIKNGYMPNLQIDRINNNGNYCPENCRWVTAKQNGNNKNNNHLMIYNNETHTISEWSDITGIKQQTIKSRLNISKWSIEKTLTTSLKDNNIYIEYKSEIKSLKEWSKMTGFKKETLRRRIFFYKWDIEKALTFPLTQ